MSVHATTIKTIRCLMLAGISAGLLFTGTASHLRAAENRMVNAIPGRWSVVQDIQEHLDGMSPTPHSQGGVVEKFGIELFALDEFWNLREVQQYEKPITKLAATQQHEIVAAGFFQATVVDKPLAWFAGYFLLTQKEGESFLCVLHGNRAAFSAWRIHHIPGKVRDKDLLLVEIGGKPNDRQIAAFKYDGETNPKSDSGDERTGDDSNK